MSECCRTSNTAVQLTTKLQNVKQGGRPIKKFIEELLARRSELIEKMMEDAPISIYAAIEKAVNQMALASLITASLEEGTSRMTFIVHEVELPFEFHVVSNDFPISTDGLLGRDFLNKYGISVNYANWTLDFPSNLSINLLDVAQSYGITIPPRSEISRKFSNFNFNEDQVSIGGEIIHGVSTTVK